MENKQPDRCGEIKGWGSAEFDQFYISDDEFITKKPIQIDFFQQRNLKICQIACGSQHTLILTNNGQVYSLGSNDEGQLGREVEEENGEKFPGLVSIPVPIDQISAGEAHSLAANSKNGQVYFWGVYRNAEKGKMNEPESAPKRIGENEFKKKVITKILSGSNHSMILCGERVYVSGDPDTGVLGRKPLTRRKFAQGQKLEAMQARKVKDIYTGGNHAFFKILQRDKDTKKEHTCYYGWGLNNWGQLGIGTINTSHQPIEISSLRNLNIKDIKGGEFHTLFLTEEGRLQGAGRNEDSQLSGNLDYQSYEDKMNEQMDEKNDQENPKKKKSKTKGGKRGRKKKNQDGQMIIEENDDEDDKNDFPEQNEDDASLQINENNIVYPTYLNNFENIHKIFCGAHYNFCFDEENVAYTWGLGYNYVCANGKEDTVETPHKVHPLFWRGKVACMDLGASHGMFSHGNDDWEPAELDDGVYVEIKPQRKNRKNTTQGAESVGKASRKSKSVRGRSKKRGASKSKVKSAVGKKKTVNNVEKMIMEVDNDSGNKTLSLIENKSDGGSFKRAFKHGENPEQKSAPEKNSISSGKSGNKSQKSGGTGKKIRTNDDIENQGNKEIQPEQKVDLQIEPQTNQIIEEEQEEQVDNTNCGDKRHEVNDCEDKSLDNKEMVDTSDNKNEVDANNKLDNLNNPNQMIVEEQTQVQGEVNNNYEDNAEENDGNGKNNSSNLLEQIDNLNNEINYANLNTNNKDLDDLNLENLYPDQSNYWGS